MIEHVEFTHETGTGIKRISSLIATCKREVLDECVHVDEIRALCELGCVNYDNKWCCPPLSTPYFDFALAYPTSTVLCFSMELKLFPNSMNQYQRVKAANMVLKGKIEKAARSLERIVGGYALLSGSCRLCRSCMRKVGASCKHPAEMRPSMESTGINVNDLLKRLFDFELQWHGGAKRVERTAVAACVLHSKTFTPQLHEYLDLEGKGQFLRDRH